MTALLEAQSISMTIGGATLVDGIDLRIKAGEMIAIVGPNGAGKSTLLGLMLGRIAPDAGRASLGSSVAIGEIDQARSQLAGTQPLADAFEGLVPELASGEVRTVLAKFGLRADHVLRPVDALSPGERTRAGLALLQVRGVNVLVLDEPTNHLDLPAIEQLEQALESYEGTLLLVTHDRRMLEQVHLDRRLHVDGGEVTEA
jgi:ATPase subunit of ABC transporter with duplicated ATPase domains